MERTDALSVISALNRIAQSLHEKGEGVNEALIDLEYKLAELILEVRELRSEIVAQGDVLVTILSSSLNPPPSK